MTPMHDLTCPCSLCQEVRREYEAWLDQIDLESFTRWLNEQIQEPRDADERQPTPPRGKPAA